MPNFIYGEYKNTFKNAELEYFQQEIFKALEKNGHLVSKKSVRPVLIYCIFKSNIFICIIQIQNYEYNLIVSSYAGP